MPGGPPTGIGGDFLSPLEAAIVNALLAAGVPRGSQAALSGKQVAARRGRAYETALKYTLVGLEERRVLSHTPNEGYRGPAPRAQAE
jgi:hypothetical protein